MKGKRRASCPADESTSVLGELGDEGVARKQ
jgi:hypothetical protein